MKSYDPRAITSTQCTSESRSSLIAAPERLRALGLSQAGVGQLQGAMGAVWAALRSIYQVRQPFLGGP
jgi:hypothetical protein